MRKLFPASALLAVFAVVCPMVAATPRPASSTPSLEWSGCYAGAHFGGAWSHLNITDVGDDGVAFASRGSAGQIFPATGQDILTGGQVGCGGKAGRSIVGVESDLGWMGLNESSLDPGTSSNTTVGINSGFYADIAGRVGARYRRTLLYGKAGVAFYDGKQTLSTQTPTYVASNTTHIGLFSGYVLGAGIEYHLPSNWSCKIEYAYYGFPSQTFNTTNVYGAVYPFGEKLSVNTVKVGVNYQFRRRR
jgi:outer membrane immunogenic protein